MIYPEFPPLGSLEDLITAHWEFSLPAASGSSPAQHTVPPDGTVNLCLLPSGMIVVVGPRMTALRVPVQSGQTYRGVRFLPGAAGPVLGVDARSLRDRVAPFCDTEIADAMQHGSDAVDRLFLERRKRIGWSDPDLEVAELIRRILRADGACSVGALIADLDLSYRQVLRRFYVATGLTPKEFARLRRMRAACLHAVRRADPVWVDVSVSAGFADQSHLVREFHDMFGWSPRLVHEYLRRIDHIGVQD